jgi:Uma2 family endonuclease
VVEVIPESTRSYDRSEKLDHYKTIPSLHDYLVAAQDEARVMLYTRHEGHWDYRDAAGLEENIFLPSVDVTLALTDIYALIEFPIQHRR